MRRAAFGVLVLPLLLAGCPAQDGAQAPSGTAAAPRGPEAAPRPPVQSDHPSDPGGATASPAGEASPTHVSDPALVTWLTKLEQVPPERFVPRAEVEEPLAVYLTQSSGASGFNLLPAVDPHRDAAAGATWSAHAASGPDGIDLVRCRYRALDRDMELREGWNLQALTIALERPLDRAGLEALLAQVVRTERLDGTTWRFELPATLDPGRPQHLTNVGAPPVEALTSRDQRVDVLVSADELTLVFYKRVEQLAVWNQDPAWFRDAARAALTR